MLYEGCVTANKKTGTDPQIQNDGASGCMVFATSFVNINHAYTALLLYARQRRLLNGVPFKLKTVALAGDLGGRGVNFKPHSKGFGYNPAHGGSYLVDPHQGYLTDMFFMFDAVKNRQITTHGEFVLQAIGRLCTIVKDDQLTMMARTPPRLWTSLSCYNIISTFARGVQQWVSVMQSKAPGESMAAAVLRSIQAEPERLAALYKIYVLPTTDSRWAKKELWLRTTRLVNSDRNLGEIIRTAPLRSPVALNHGIGHDPETDQWNHMQKAIGMAEVEVAQRKANGQDVDDGMQGAAGSSRDPPRRNVRRRIDPAVMQAKFLRIYEDHPDLAKTTGPTPQNMPSYDDLIYVKWSDWHRFPHYPAKVVNIRIVEEDGDCFQTVYTIRFTTDDAMNSLAESEQFVHDNQRLDPDMAEWQYINPNT